MLFVYARAVQGNGMAVRGYNSPVHERDLMNLVITAIARNVANRWFFEYSVAPQGVSPEDGLMFTSGKAAELASRVWERESDRHAKMVKAKAAAAEKAAKAAEKAAAPKPKAPRQIDLFAALSARIEQLETAIATGQQVIPAPVQVQAARKPRKPRAPRTAPSETGLIEAHAAFEESLGQCSLPF